MPSAMTDPALLQRFDALLDRLDRLLPPPLPPTDWTAPAFRWQRWANQQATIATK